MNTLHIVAAVCIILGVIGLGVVLMAPAHTGGNTVTEKLSSLSAEEKQILTKSLPTCDEKCFDANATLTTARENKRCAVCERSSVAVLRKK